MSNLRAQCLAQTIGHRFDSILGFLGIGALARVQGHGRKRAQKKYQDQIASQQPTGGAEPIDRSEPHMGTAPSPLGRVFYCCRPARKSRSEVAEESSAVQRSDRRHINGRLAYPSGRPAPLSSVTFGRQVGRANADPLRRSSSAFRKPNLRHTMSAPSRQFHFG